MQKNGSTIFQKIARINNGDTMKIVFDPSADAAYIYLSTNTKEISHKTYTCDPCEVGGQINLDFDEFGHLIGIEVLDARQLLPEDVLNNSEKHYLE
jgi:uncharacterized protein YuzE